MRRFRAQPLTAAVALLVSASLLVVRLSAQVPGCTITPLLRSTFGDDARMDAVMLTVDLAPGGSPGRHTHPGDLPAERRGWPAVRGGRAQRQRAAGSAGLCAGLCRPL